MLTRARIDSIIIELVNKECFPGDHAIYGCAPVRDSFIVYIHPCHISDIEKLPGFISVECYPPNITFPELPENEIGAVSNMRFLISNKIDTSSIVTENITRTIFKIKE